MLESASPAQLLEADDQEPWARVGSHRVVRALCTGEASPQAARALVVVLSLVLTGRARYMLASKVSWLALDDGKEVFADLHRALTLADADADAGWARVAAGLRISDEDLEAASPDALAAAEDLVAVVRDHGLRSAHEGVGVAWVLDRQLPVLLGEIASGLTTHYGLLESDVSHLSYRAGEAPEAAERVRRLTERYLVEPWQVYEARRAAREVLWGFTALFETVER